MELLLGVFTAFGLSASSGLNAYIPLLIVSLLARFTNLITLQAPWDTLESWWIIGLLIVLSSIEFFADKVPAVNHINDILQTFVRPAAGAIVFASSASVITNINPIFSMGIGLLVAGSVHAAKSAAVRPMVTATTAGTGNVFVSLLEDIFATVVSLMSIIVPFLLFIFFIILLVLVWALRRKKISLNNSLGDNHG